MRSFILILAMVGVPLMTTPVSIDAAPVEGLSVVDSNGNNVGPVLDVYGLTVPRVAVQVNETIFVVSILEDGFASFSGPSFLYFNNPACTGQAAANILDAIVPGTTPQVLPWVFIGPDGGTVYTPSPSPNGTQISGFVAQSHFRTTGNPPIVICEHGTEVIPTAVAAAPITNLLNSYTPPFSIQAQGKRGGRR